MSRYLKIGFLGDSLSRGGGGLVEVQLALANHLKNIGHDVSVFGIRDAHFEDDKRRWLPVRPQAASGSSLFNLGFSIELRRNVMGSNCDVFHLHTLWKYSSAIVTQWSRQKNSPFLITPHGMLEPWARTNSGFKKVIASYLYENRMRRKAACIHVFTEKEKNDIRALGLNNPIAIIPNGVDLAEFDKTIGRDKSKPDVRIALYLGRLHPKKGLAMLLRAWQKAMQRSETKQNWCLAIAGWDQNGHENELKLLCDELSLRRQDKPAADFVESFANSESQPEILFLGPAFGELKSKLYSCADAFVLPSLSEGLPMTILEAWASSLPVLMTQDCNLPEGESAGAALVCDSTEPAIEAKLRELRELSTVHLITMGENGRRLVESSFQWKSIAEELATVYAWVLGQGPKPTCVQTV